MFNKMIDIIDLFRKGAAVANKEAWATGGNAAALLTIAVMAAVKVAGDFGIGIQLSTEDATAIASGISTFVLFITHNISNNHAGVLPAKPVTEDVQDTPAADTEKMQPVSQPTTNQNDNTYTG